MSSKRRAGWQPAVLRADDDYEIWSLPQIVWVDPSPAAFRPRGGGAQPGTPQIILNYARVAREPWRLKAVIDNQGLAISSRFVAFRPKPGGPTLKSLWAVLNSPVANAYAYCFSGKRETLVKEWRAFPLPAISPAGESAIAAAADHYLALVKAAEDSFMQNSDRNAIRSALRAVDAEVLRLYDLPPRLERQLLDLFAGVERKGVGCEFGGYYPEGLDAFVPLHELLSEEYSRSTAENLRRSHVPLTQGSVLNALRMAASQVAEG